MDSLKTIVEAKVVSMWISKYATEYRAFANNYASKFDDESDHVLNWLIHQHQSHIIKLMIDDYIDMEV